MRNVSEQSYRSRVMRVLNQIVMDPMADYSLEQLADIAHFSPCHFHRIYRAITGETVNHTIRRLRLADAARRLGQGEATVTEVGQQAGYDSPQAFSRAFREFTGSSPSQFQQQLGAPAKLAGVRLVDLGPLRAYGLRHSGPLATIPHTHRHLHGLLVDKVPVLHWLGLSSGDPEVADDFAYYAAAVPVDEQTGAEAMAASGLQALDIPGGGYAMHSAIGPYSRIAATLNAMFSHWLPASGFEPAARPLLEFYVSDSRATPVAQLRTELYLPIRPAGY